MSVRSGLQEIFRLIPLQYIVNTLGSEDQIIGYCAVASTSENECQTNPECAKSSFLAISALAVSRQSSATH